jgi:hypothetical protein
MIQRRLPLDKVGPLGFDDPEVRLRHVLGQDAPLAEGGRHVIYNCTICRRPWYRAGKREYPRITAAQLVLLRNIFHIEDAKRLPEALCRVCSTGYLGGAFSIEEYWWNKGFHVSWEGVSPSRSFLVAMVHRRELRSLQDLLGSSPDTLLASGQTVKWVLDWLSKAAPSCAHGMGEEECMALARRLPPGCDMSGLPRIWKGFAWIDDCPALGEEVIVTLALAIDPRLADRVSLAHLAGSWKLLATFMALLH